MNELKATLRDLEQRYLLFKQQQFTFVAALDHTRENAHDKTKPVSTLSQVQNYLDHYCNNSTDKRILIMFLDLCKDLSDFCSQLEDINPKACSPDDRLEKCKLLLSCNNDMSHIRAKSINISLQTDERKHWKESSFTVYCGNDSKMKVLAPLTGKYIGSSLLSICHLIPDDFSAGILLFCR
ncbi:sperm acrosome-associated protein 9 isoform X5 [Chiloscyllium plagiosum]|uniref:sperm acrosome-associated protein 9 isoform X5 n=1 Tax=Chiloscyllium plagiosum TaxID=36176 RepID=UPI001CB7CBF2|nr:sperm acrosome-associated protein 9 isoform X5 [Chiloscyllium plagiosum]